MNLSKLPWKLEEISGLIDLSRFLQCTVSWTFMWAAKPSLRHIATVTKWSLTTSAFTPLLDVGTKFKVLSVFSLCVYTLKWFYFYLYSLGSSLKTLSWVLLAVATWDQELYETFPTPQLISALLLLVLIFKNDDPSSLFP